MIETGHCRMPLLFHGPMRDGASGARRFFQARVFTRLTFCEATETYHTLIGCCPQRTFVPRPMQVASRSCATFHRDDMGFLSSTSTTRCQSTGATTIVMARLKPLTRELS